MNTNGACTTAAAGHTKSTYLASIYIDQTSLRDVSQTEQQVEVVSPKQSELANEVLRVQALRDELNNSMEQKTLLEEQIRQIQLQAKWT